MQTPLRVSFHGLEHSISVHDAVRKKAEQLDRYHPRLLSCRVTLELGGRHKSQGRQFAVCIDLKVPGGELAVARQHDEDLQIALRDAFRAARRRLEDHARAADDVTLRATGS